MSQQPTLSTKNFKVNKLEEELRKTKEAQQTKYISDATCSIGLNYVFHYLFLFSRKLKQIR